MTAIVLSEDSPLKRTEDERLAEERRLRGGQPRKLEPTEDVLTIVRGLGSIMATMAEAAATFNVSEKTFARFLRTFTAAREAWEYGQGNGKVSLRRTQFALAKENAAMAIFLGKNYLGQTDKREYAHAHSVTPVDPGASQQEAAERYAETMRLPPSLRLIAPKEIEGEAVEILDGVPADAEASMEDHADD